MKEDGPATQRVHLRDGQEHRLLKQPNSEDRMTTQRGRTFTENLERVKKIPSINFYHFT